MTTTDLQAFLAAQRESFRASLASRLAALERAWPADPQEVLRLAHQLAGTAGTFGFAPLGEAAAALEEALAADAAPAALDARVADLRAGLAAALGAPDRAAGIRKLPD